ncbi:Tn3 family transposase [Serratia marcescens]|uniref:Tn3 family transposase n=1 Tax=Serratia marcescens TaxID=615 RepID=UPI003D180FA4
MPRRQILSSEEQARLLVIPDDEIILTRMCFLSDKNIALINKHRRPANRLGFAVLLCYLRGPGFVPDKNNIPHYTKVISRVRDSTHVLDGLLYHESDLEITEHYTDTAGFTEHVFALMHLLGFAFAPRIRDLHDKRLFIQGKAERYPGLQSVISTTSLNIKDIETYWDEVLRLAASIKQGTVTASLMMKKLASYPKQNGLAKALREIGRIERTLFMLDWFRDPGLRRRVQAGLNKGEARNALARAVFMHRLGEIRDRGLENQSYRASGLTLLTAAIALWNTVYIERAIESLKRKKLLINDQLLSHLSPLGWEHINLNGDYVWRNNLKLGTGKYRPLRSVDIESYKKQS